MVNVVSWRFSLLHKFILCAIDCDITVACQTFLEATVLGTYDCSKQTLLKSEESRVFRSQGVWKIINRHETKMVKTEPWMPCWKCGGGGDRKDFIEWGKYLSVLNI